MYIGVFERKSKILTTVETYQILEILLLQTLYLYLLNTVPPRVFSEELTWAIPSTQPRKLMFVSNCHNNKHITY